MSQRVEVRCQAEFEAALKVSDAIIALLAGVYELVTRGLDAPWIEVNAGVELTVVARESSQPRVEAWGSSQPRVEAWGSSQPRVEARESSQPRVEARGSSQPRVEARESSQPRVEAWGSSQPRVEASGYVQLSVLGCVVAKATAKCSVLIHGTRAQVEGGQQTKVVIETPEDWCAYYGVPVKDGVAVLFKGVDDNFRSPRGGDYTPGTVPRARDWDGGERECGGGYHFSPTPAMTLEFAPEATHFVACPVALHEIAIHPDGEYPQKSKAAGCCAPCWECDRDGEPIAAAAESEVRRE